MQRLGENTVKAEPTINGKPTGAGAEEETEVKGFLQGNPGGDRGKMEREERVQIL